MGQNRSTFSNTFARTGWPLKQQELIARLRDELAQIVTQTEGNTAMSLTDHNKIAEDLICGLMREILDFRGLKNLNASERENYPAIDLADFSGRVAVQVTATPRLDKIKSTIRTFNEHKLDGSFDRLIVYILTRKQRSYSQSAIDKVARSRLSFDGKSDILDFKDLLGSAVHLEPARLAAALRVVEAYNRGVPIGLAEEDFDPPQQTEDVTLNLVELFFPPTLYVADVSPEFLKRPKGMGRKPDREILRHHGRERGKVLPSDFYVYSGQLITFHNLKDEENPFAWAVDAGTIVDITPKEFYGVDDAQERVFKALLRYTFQEKLYRQRVLWRHEVKLFAFMPIEEDEMHRDISWQGLKRAKRRVYERTMNKNDPEKVFAQKHFAFAVDFYLLDKRWYISLTPDWYFSYGSDFNASRYGPEKISWLKRQENNSALEKHFRFLFAWLTELDADDMFSETNCVGTNVSIGNAVSLPGHPALPDDLWLPVRAAEQDSTTGNLFADREGAV